MRALVFCLSAVFATALGAQDAKQHALRGVVVATSGRALGYAMVSVTPGGAERFTDDSGRFNITGLAPGKYRLRARHLGYTPLDTVLTLGAGAPSPAMRLVLQPIARLSGVRVVERSSCESPGPPDSTRSPELVRAFAQLRENAERSRVLADSYPFAYLVIRNTTVRWGKGELQPEGADTVEWRSNDRWRYAPGTLIGVGRQGRYLNLPTLPDLADVAFQNAHCFSYPGAETVEGESLLRIDFRAWARLQSPDVDGSAWLDPETYQLRRLEISLTNPQWAMQGISSVRATMSFREILPDIVIPELVTSVSTLPTLGSNRRVSERRESTRLVRFAFLGVRSDSTAGPH